MAVDPVTAAKLWLLIRPIKKFKQWRKRHLMQSWLAEHGRPADEFSLPPDEAFMSDAQQSFVRSLLKVFAGVLVTKGVIDVGEASSLQVLLETVVAAGVGAWAFWQSHKKHTQA